MSLFKDLNRANRIMLGLETIDEAKKDQVDDEKPGKVNNNDDVEQDNVEDEQPKKVNDNDEDPDNVKDDEPKKVEEAEEEDEEEEEIEEAKKCEENDEEDEEEEEDEEVDESLKALFDLGYELMAESNYSIYVCEDCGALHECAGECEDCGGELEEAMKMVVKNGKVVKKKVNKKKRKMSAKQKQALKKAQKASQKGDAKKKRAKSMKVRVKKGLDEGYEEFECPECGFIGDMEEVEQGVFICPECDAELEIDGQIAREVDENKEVDESLELYKRALDIPEFVLNEGDDLVKKYLKNVFGIDFE